jgi:hypothetical protein
MISLPELDLPEPERIMIVHRTSDGRGWSPKELAPSLTEELTFVEGRGFQVEHRDRETAIATWRRKVIASVSSSVLEIMLYPMRDGVHFGATVRWAEDGSERTMRIMGGISRMELLNAIGAVFDKRVGKKESR